MLIGMFWVLLVCLSVCQVSVCGFASVCDCVRVLMLSHQATGPFLQLGAVVALTLLSWLVFKSYFRARRRGQCA